MRDFPTVSESDSFDYCVTPVWQAVHLVHPLMSRRVLNQGVLFLNIRRENMYLKSQLNYPLKLWRFVLEDEEQLPTHLMAIAT